jgi:AcrR family transcriptional regulator
LELVDEQARGGDDAGGVVPAGVRSMSLYRYVQDRDELFDAVVERIVNGSPTIRTSAASGRWVAALSHGYGTWGAPLRPGASACLPLVLLGRRGSVGAALRSLRWVEAMLTGLAAEGFTDEQVLFTYRTFNSFARLPVLEPAL